MISIRVKSTKEEGSTLAKKENKYYVVSVKTNGGRLSELEKKELEMSKKFDFFPMLIRTKITLFTNLEDVTMEIL